MKKNWVVCLVIIVILIVGIIYLSIPQKIGPPTTPSKGLVENAGNYCGQFNEKDCNSNKFLDTAQYPAPINCYWNLNTLNCDAGIGYQ